MSAAPDPAAVVAQVDHLIYATPDRDASVAALEELLGVRAEIGGQHLGLGTHNALLSLGSAYLEIIGPDPAQPRPAGARVFGVDAVSAPRLTTWAGRGEELEAVARRAAAAGVPLGAIRRGGRRRPDGSQLSWRCSDVHAFLGDGLVPFFIAWDQPDDHPARTAPRAGELVALRAEHPRSAAVQEQLEGVGLTLPLRPGPRPALIATVETAHGRVELR